MALARGQWLGVLLAGVVLTGCAGQSRPVELSVNRDPASPDFGVVEIWGLTLSVRRALAAVPPDDGRWAGAIAVRVAGGNQPMPSLAGRYAVTKNCVRFVPRFRPEGPLTYRVRFDPVALAKLAGRSLPAGEVQQRSYELPGRPLPPSTTRVTGIYPSAGVIPANQLRWYLEFSAPMREGEAARHVHLVDQRGAEVDGAFLSVEEELWDRDRRRITLFFDMGRVKRAIRTRMEEGPVLRPGRRYVLRIDRDWRDARGAPLLDSVVHPFVAGPEDHTPVVPARWRLEPPTIGTRAPLTVDFGEPLDHALASHLITVTGSDGTPLTGEVRLGRDDRSWRFIPDGPWYGERYQLRVHPALEDLSGNRVGYAFDADLRGGERAGVDSAVAVLEFLPTGERGTR